MPKCVGGRRPRWGAHDAPRPLVGWGGVGSGGGHAPSNPPASILAPSGSASVPQCNILATPVCSVAGRICLHFLNQCTFFHLFIHLLNRAIGVTEIKNTMVESYFEKQKYHFFLPDIVVPLQNHDASCGSLNFAEMLSVLHQTLCRPTRAFSGCMLSSVPPPPSPPPPPSSSS